MIRTAVFALLATSAFAAPALAETRLEVRHAAARMIVIPEARSDISWTVQGGRAGLPALQMRREGDKLILDGGLGEDHWRSRVHGCDLADHSVRIDGVGSVKLADLPVITAHVPLDARITAGEAVFGEIGPTRSLSIGNGGCGDWKVGPVQGLAHVALGGMGSVRLDRVGDADVDLGGMGNVSLASAGRLHVNIGGSGSVRAGEVTGDLHANIGGRGDIQIERGSTPHVYANIAGSGSIVSGGTVGAVNATIMGSGNIKAREITGPIHKMVMGSGTVRAGV